MGDRGVLGSRRGRLAIIAKPPLLASSLPADLRISQLRFKLRFSIGEICINLPLLKNGQKNLSGKAVEWFGGTKEDQEVYTILLTTPQYRNLLPAVCTLIEVGGVQWMETATCERGFSPNPHQDWSAILVGGLSICCSHDDLHEWT